MAGNNPNNPYSTFSVLRPLMHETFYPAKLREPKVPKLAVNPMKVQPLRLHPAIMAMLTPPKPPIR